MRHGLGYYIALIHPLNIRQLLLNVMLEGNLKLSDDPNDGMALVIKLLTDLEVYLANHARQVVQCFYLSIRSLVFHVIH